ncbi:MAG: hypothetical protein PF693_05375 [Spirochaetia bacterium]|jgi:hypothetical protein|nr:hypothetical protein [Spirochaetia bacterium]
MSDKVVVIISTSEAEKARTGMMYAVNAVLNNWMADVKLIFFGPAQELLLEDIVMKDFLIQFQQAEGKAVSCKFIVDRDEIDKETSALGVKSEYVGSMISDLIKDGYIPMVW